MTWRSTGGSCRVRGLVRPRKTSTTAAASGAMASANDPQAMARDAGVEAELVKGGLQSCAPNGPAEAVIQVGGGAGGASASRCEAWHLRRVVALLGEVLRVGAPR